jgi:two-component system sensor histidine kinase PilS (NtrC family)
MGLISSTRIVHDCGRMSQSMGLLLVSRLMLAGAAIVAGQTFLGRGTASVTLLYVAAAVLVVAMMYMYLLRRSYPGLPLLHLQIGADLIVVTWVVALTGRGESPFVLLYFVSIILAGYFLLIRGGVMAAAGAGVAYLAAAFAPALLGQGTAGSGDVLQNAVNVAFFFVVGTLSGYLGRTTRRQELSLELARKELKKARLDTDCIIRNMGSGLLTVDSSQKVTHFNPAAAAILRVNAERVKGADLSVFKGLGMGALSDTVRTTVTEGREMPRRELEVSTVDGTLIPVGVSTSVIRDESGEPAGAVAVFQDLTEAREMEQKARSNETLAAIGELASAVAHEIRNCLSPISGSVEVLAEQLNVEGENKQLLDLIYRESRHLEKFIGALLDFARVTPLSIDDVDAEDLLDDVLDSLKRHPSFRHKLTVRTSQEMRGSVRADRELLRQAFLNLGINALEASREGGPIEVRLEYRSSGNPAKGNTMVVEFVDKGEGIAADHQARVFEPFFTMKKKGSGLGLAVVKQIVERHGGSVSLQSTAGEGTSIKLELPCQAVEIPRAA